MASRILIVDDHPLVREGLAARIGRQSGWEVCGEAESAEEALEQVGQTQPDLVVVDISLKGGDGISLIRDIHSRFDYVKTLVSSMHDESLYAERALRAGASGYINKQEMPDKVLDAIQQVLNGKLYLSQRMTEQLLQRAVGGLQLRERMPVENLSDRELQVFRMIGKGLKSRQVADELHLSIKTVETHRENIKAKLGVRNSAELARQAVQWALENG